MRWNVICGEQALIQDAVLKWKQKRSTSDSESQESEPDKDDAIALMARPSSG